VGVEFIRINFFKIVGCTETKGVLSILVSSCWQTFLVCQIGMNLINCIDVFIFCSIDATHSRKTGRFINHSALQPNITPKIIDIQGSPKMYFMSIKVCGEKKGSINMFQGGERQVLVSI
jgi:hypothetical protein